MDTPLLLIAWRRPHTLRQVIDAIRPVAPNRIFVACDGPNPERPGEAEKVAATRAVIEHEIDWPCQIERLYSDVNQGCRLGPSRAITWFFAQVEEGIVLEDDCVPHPDFFPFCTELLERYRDDERIFLITGHNREGVTDTLGNYFFSKLGGIWGWASWRRAWAKNVISTTLIEEAKRLHILENLVSGELASERYAKCIDSLTGQLDAWDYEWGFCRLVNSGLCCVPRVNLISNVGNDAFATHTHGLPPNEIFADRLLFPLSHSQFVVPLQAYDSLYESPKPSLAQVLISSIRVRIKPVIPARIIAIQKRIHSSICIKSNQRIVG